MAVWSAVKLSALGRRMRLDPEFYQPYLLTYERLLGKAPFPVLPLGNLVRDGYRVVYENTEILETDEPEKLINAVQFLQADDINASFPAINTMGMGWVSRKDWDRYEKGRVIPGELLIEVKGLARKVAIVPDDFPRETLVTGSVFKLQTRAEVLDPYFLLAYLLSKFGVGFRFRCLTNTLIGFVNKEELYAIPVVVPSPQEQQAIASIVRQALDSWRRASRAIASAELRLIETLGLDQLDLTPQKCYTQRFRDLRNGNRFGAEYYMPCKKRVLDAFAKLPHRTIADHAPAIREIWDPTRASKDEKVRNFDITDALEPFLDDVAEPQSATEIGSTKKRFQAGDVVISRLRSYLREIAVVRTSDALSAVGSSEFIVLRPTGKGLSAETLMVFLRSPLVQTVLKWSQDGSNHPRFAEKDLLAIPVPDAALRVQKKIDALVQESIDARRQAARLLEQAKKTVENMIAGEASGEAE
jgi:type I restriction enzyme S subunit